MPNYDSIKRDDNNKISKRLAIIGIIIAIIIGLFSLGYAYFSILCLEYDLKNFLRDMDMKNDAYFESIYCKLENPDKYCNIQFVEIPIKENHWCLDPIGKRFVAVTTTNSSITNYYP